MDKHLLILIIWNITVMLVYGLDKMLAKMHHRRISENALLSCAFLFGGCGAILGMVLFNHKTSKMKFRILIPTAFFFCIVVTYYHGGITIF